MLANIKEFLSFPMTQGLLIGLSFGVQLGLIIGRYYEAVYVIR